MGQGVVVLQKGAHRPAALHCENPSHKRSNLTLDVMSAGARVTSWSLLLSSVKMMNIWSARTHRPRSPHSATVTRKIYVCPDRLTAGSRGECSLCCNSDLRVTLTGQTAVGNNRTILTCCAICLIYLTVDIFLSESTGATGRGYGTFACSVHLSAHVTTASHP